MDSIALKTYRDLEDPFLDVYLSTILRRIFVDSDAMESKFFLGTMTRMTVSYSHWVIS